jgi:hypothetical protein
LTNAIEQLETSNVIGVWTRDWRLGPFNAVMVHRRRDGWEILWKKSSSQENVDLETFLNSIVLETQSLDEPEESKPQLTIGFNSSSVVFHRINIPPVTDDQVERIVRIQAEALLPLPLDQMRLGWRVGDVADGRRVCTLAAARREGLEEFVTSARVCEVSKIYLDGEAIVKVWNELFGGTEKQSVLIRIGLTKTSVLLAEGGRLSHAVTLDVGEGDLSGGVENRTRDLFVHDVQNALEMFGVLADKSVQVFVLSPDVEDYEALVLQLRASGLNALAEVPSMSMLAEPLVVEPAEVYKNLEAIGSAMLEVDSHGDEIDLFNDLQIQSQSQEKSQSLRALKRPSVVALVIVVLFLLVSYAVDKASLARLDDGRINVAVERKKLRELIGRNRPDIISLLNMIGESMPEGIILDSFEFEKGRVVSVSSNAPNYEKVYEFQKALENKKNITDVEIQKAVFDEKKNRVSFKMAFHYGKFTKKK